MYDKKLYESDHSYYCSEINYFKRSVGFAYDSWEEFFEDWKDSDEDMNFLVRWDWLPQQRYREDHDADGGLDSLELFFLLQRKGYFLPITVQNITKEDEPLIKEYLQSKWQYIKTLWSPVSE